MGYIHSKYECVAFQEAGYKVDTDTTNDTVERILGREYSGSGEIFADVESYRRYLQAGGFSPYSFISTLRALMIKGKYL